MTQTAAPIGHLDIAGDDLNALADLHGGLLGW
ncbi:hypothetical protein SAMN05880582_10532 [Rhizobium sp. RU20A]|nr:hypothetical protein SAMN05880582_10532 [Rhizobium sp. RU20A]